MPRLIINRGVSGSGKSTWARMQTGFIIVSRDEIRMQLFGTESFTDEDAVTIVQDAQIKALLKAGRDVIVDDTNITWKYVMRLANLGYSAGAAVELKVFDVPLQRAINNNTWRAANGGRDVPRDVITKQHQRFQGNKNNTLPEPFVPNPYHGTPGKPKAFLVDIDGTLAHMRDYRGPFDWAKVGLDDVDEVISEVVTNLHESRFSNYKVIIMSGRDASCYSETEDWLLEHDIYWDELFMRPKNDMRKDNIVKAELFDTHVRDNFDVRFVLDDRQQVVDMWRSMGITCLQVAPGDF